MEEKKQQHKEEAMNNMDKRLEAIKEIIVGNNFEKIEAKISRVAQTVEQTNTRVLGVVEQLSEELGHIKQSLEAKIAQNDKKSFEDDEELRNALFELDQKLNDRLATLEENDQHQDTSLSNHESALQKVEQAVEHNNIRISENAQQIEKLEDTLASIRRDFSKSLEELKQEVRSLYTADQQLYNALSEEVEDRRADMHKLNTEVNETHNELKAFLKERSRVFVARQEKLEGRMEKVDERILGLHDLIEDDVFKYFEDLKSHKKENRKRLQDLSQDIYNQMDEAMLKMEGRIDGLMEANSRDIKKLNKKLKQKESIKRTLGRLGDLLDD